MSHAVCVRHEHGLSLSSNPHLLMIWRLHMSWSIALLALLNIGVGYVLALYMERGRRNAALAASDDLDADIA
jgi:hypothetical protein